MINDIFDLCVQLLHALAQAAGTSYKTVNVVLFVLVWPAITLWLWVRGHRLSMDHKPWLENAPEGDTTPGSWEHVEQMMCDYMEAKEGMDMIKTFSLKQDIIRAVAWQSKISH